MRTDLPHEALWSALGGVLANPALAKAPAAECARRAMEAVSSLKDQVSELVQQSRPAPAPAASGRQVGLQREAPPPVEAVQAQLEQVKLRRDDAEVRATAAKQRFDETINYLGVLLAGEPEASPDLGTVEQRVGQLVMRLKRELTVARTTPAGQDAYFIVNAIDDAMDWLEVHGTTDKGCRDTIADLKTARDKFGGTAPVEVKEAANG